MGSQVSHDAFISYSSHDKTVADAACATLESSRLRCWIAPRDILPGVDYGQAIIEAIHGCQVCIVVFSARANMSTFVTREVERAVSQGKPVLPLRIEDVTPSGAMEFYLSTSHWLDALTPPLEEHLDRLVVSVKALLAVAAPAESAAVERSMVVNASPAPADAAVGGSEKRDPAVTPPSSAERTVPAVREGDVVRVCVEQRDGDGGYVVRLSDGTQARLPLREIPVPAGIDLQDLIRPGDTFDAVIVAGPAGDEPGIVSRLRAQEGHWQALRDACAEGEPVAGVAVRAVSGKGILVDVGVWAIRPAWRWNREKPEPAEGETRQYVVGDVDERSGRLLLFDNGIDRAYLERCVGYDRWMQGLHVGFVVPAKVFHAPRSADEIDVSVFNGKNNGIVKVDTSAIKRAFASGDVLEVLVAGVDRDRNEVDLRVTNARPEPLQEGTLTILSAAPAEPLRPPAACLSQPDVVTKPGFFAGLASTRSRRSDAAKILGLLQSETAHPLRLGGWVDSRVLTVHRVDGKEDRDHILSWSSWSAEMSRRIEAALGVDGVRMRMPVDSHPYMRVEVPRPNAAPVLLSEAAPQEALAAESLRLWLGVESSGEALFADLAAMPHLGLVGATGSGKSKLIDSLLTGLLIEHSPSVLRIVLAAEGPERFATFAAAPHVALADVDLDRRLEQLIDERNARLALLEKAGVADIGEHNRVAAERLPRVVVAVDGPEPLRRDDSPLSRLLIALGHPDSDRVGLHLILAMNRSTMLRFVSSADGFGVRMGEIVMKTSDDDDPSRLRGWESWSPAAPGDYLFRLPSGGAAQRIQAPTVTAEEIECVIEAWRACEATGAAAGGSRQLPEDVAAKAGEAS